MRGQCDGDGNVCRARPAVYVAFTPETATNADQAYVVEHFPLESSCHDPVLTNEEACEAEMDCTWTGSDCITTGQPCPATVTTTLSGQVRCDHASELVSLDGVDCATNHQTGAMLVQYGDGQDIQEGTVTLGDVNNAGQNTLALATNLSFRVANVRVPAQTGPFVASGPHPLTFGVRLRGEGQGLGASIPYVTTPLVPVQQSGHSIDGETTMTTVRIAMADLCAADGLATSAVGAIDFFFDDHGLDRTVLIDTVEFTQTVDDIENMACGQFSGVYACPATQTLIATRTACDGEPTNGACPGLDVVTSGVDIPEAHDGTSPFDGWLIDAPTGIIDNYASLTQSEQEFLATRCVQACQDQWDDDPFVSANCDAGGAFATPYLVTTPSIGTRQAIPQAQQDGSGLFPDQSLECSLHDDCCELFDEADICPSAPARVTPAREPLGRGQEWEIAVGGITWANSSYAAEPVEAAMVGTIGYSFCEDGDGVHCPFYVGSLHLELTETLTLELDCNGSTEEHEITELEFDLVQPVMGIAEEGTAYKAFPPRAIVVEATGVADELPIYIRGPIELPVYYQAGEGWTLLYGYDGAYVEFEIPCNGEMADVKLAWGFDEEETLESPPVVDVSGMPASIECPGELYLYPSSAGDPDDDIVSLEWVVDGVAMDGTFPTIDFTQAHEVTAIVRDARGAAHSDSKTITCQ